jgi:hypothetical protein
MGEINVLPDIHINDIDISEVAMVILPGCGDISEFGSSRACFSY